MKPVIKIKGTEGMPFEGSVREVLKKAASLFISNVFKLSCVQISLVSKEKCPDKKWYGFYSYKENVIYLNRESNFIDIVETLFHELAHQYQIYTQKLVFKNGKRYFCGKEECGDESLYKSEIEAKKLATRLHSKLIFG